MSWRRGKQCEMQTSGYGMAIHLEQLWSLRQGQVSHKTQEGLHLAEEFWQLKAAGRGRVVLSGGMHGSSGRPLPLHRVAALTENSKVLKKREKGMKMGVQQSVRGNWSQEVGSRQSQNKFHTLMKFSKYILKRKKKRTKYANNSILRCMASQIKALGSILST